MYLRNLTTFCICLALFLPSVAFSQAIKHKITPRVIDKEVEQRDIFVEDITIDNFSNNKITVYPSVNAVIIDEGGDIIDFSPPSMSDNSVTVTSWLEISRAGVELTPGATTSLPLTIRINPKAEPGVYHAFIGFGTGRNRDIAERQVRDGIAPGVIVTLSVDQDTVQGLKLQNFIVERFITGAEKDSVQYTLTNPGSAEVVPEGEIIISNNRGEEVGSITINPNQDALAPGEARQYTTAVDSSGLLGKYKAFLNVDYNGGQLASVYDTAFFYVIPWKQLLIFFGILSFIVILLTIIIHRRYADEDEDDGEHGAAYIPLFVKDDQSKGHDHDIDLKQS